MPTHARIRIMVLLALSATGGTSWCHAWRLDWEKTGKFCGGIAASVAIHEGAHYAAAKAQGMDTTFHCDFPNIRSTNTPDEYSNTVSLAGLAANMISSEIVLGIAQERRGPFEDGILFGNIFEQLRYATVYHDDLDLDLHLPGWQKELYVAIIVGQALYTARRMNRAGHLNPRVWIGVAEDHPAAGLAFDW